MMMPATMAMIKPETTYSPATCQPNSPNNITTATSLIVGAAMRNENVTPSGTPLSTKPMNNGTALHEQNGVTMPSMAASTLPTPWRLPPSSARVRSGLKNVRRIEMRKIMPPNSRMIFGTSYRKKASDSPRCEPRSRRSRSYVIQPASGSITL